jgi:hypothetical protein
VNEFIPEGLEPVDLDKLGRELSNEVTRLGKIVAGYEAELTTKTNAYKRALAKAKILYKDTKYPATIINALAEEDEQVVLAAKYMEQAECNLIVGKAELEGHDKQYMMVKKLLDLKIQELRVFRA